MAMVAQREDQESGARSRHGQGQRHAPSLDFLSATGIGSCVERPSLNNSKGDIGSQTHTVDNLQGSSKKGWCNGNPQCAANKGCMSFSWWQIWSASRAGHPAKAMNH